MSTEIIIAIIAAAVSVFGAVSGGYVIIIAFRKSRIDAAETITEASMELADRYKKDSDKFEKRAVEFDKRIDALEEENKKLNVMLLKAFAVIKGLTGQLTDAGIKPAYKLEKE